MARLPLPGSDNGTWGDILNDFLSVSHETDGTLKTSPPTGPVLDVEAVGFSHPTVSGLSDSDYVDLTQWTASSPLPVWLSLNVDGNIEFNTQGVYIYSFSVSVGSLTSTGVGNMAINNGFIQQTFTCIPNGNAFSVLSSTITAQPSDLLAAAVGWYDSSWNLNSAEMIVTKIA